MSDMLAFVTVFTLAFSLTLVLIPISAHLGRRFGITSAPGGRRSNEGDYRRVPKLGGLALSGGFIVTVLVAQILPVARMDSYEIVRLTGLVVGGVVIFVVGILDDIFDMSALPQFLGQFLAAGIAIGFQIFIEYVNNPFTGQQTEPWPYIVTVTLSFFWLVGMMNTVNWLDGLDGLAGGVAFIAGVMLFVNSAFRVEPAQTSVSLLPLALMGVSAAFVLCNFYPAKIFMGGGALFLGYVLGTLSIIGGAKMATILLVMGLPLMDAAWQIVNRIRRGRNPTIGDRGHVHFRLQDIGFSQRQIVLIYYTFCAFFGVITLVATSQLFKLIALSTMLMLVVIGFAVLARFDQTRSSASS